MNTGLGDTTRLHEASSRRWPSSSPRIPDHALGRYPSAVTLPGQHTGAELATIADTIAGCAQVVRRLAEQPNRVATRTVGFAGLDSLDLIALTTPTSLAGMTGATATGDTWRVGPDHIIVTDKPDRPR